MFPKTAYSGDWIPVVNATCFLLSKVLETCNYCCVRCLLDTDDEVRDRATFYVNILKEKEKALSSGYILNGRC